MLQGLTMEGKTRKERQRTEFQDLIKKLSTVQGPYLQGLYLQGLFKTTTKIQDLSQDGTSHAKTTSFT